MDIKELINDIKTDKKKIFGVCCGLIILLALVGTITQPATDQTSTVATTEDLFNKSVGVKCSNWDYTPEGFPLIGEGVYGSCEGVDENGVEHTYFFTDPQMAALGNISDYSFSYDNLHLIASKNDKGHMVVEHIFYKNGTEISCDWNVNDFKAYAKIAGANNPNCVKGFGYTSDEVLNME